MMQTGLAPLSINLGRDKKDTNTSLFFKWAVNSGRIIIVAVELITLGALGYRFFIDRQIIDLHDKIQNVQLLVSSQAKSEALYTNLQGRMNTIQTLNQETQAKTDFLNQMISYLNTNDFIASDLTVSDNQINIEGDTYSIFTLNTLVDKLRSNPRVVSISIDDLASLDQGIRFKLTIQLKPSAIPL